ncbi:MAG: hypothetical protein ACLQU3_09500 [Limisphaerales bacterium]
MKYKIEDWVGFKVTIPVSQQPKNKWGAKHTEKYTPQVAVAIGQVVGVLENEESYEIATVDKKTYLVPESDVIDKATRDQRSGKWELET